MKERETILVIGNGMTGYKFCEKFSDLGLGNQYDLVVFGEEPNPAYDRVHLTDYYTGKPLDELTLAPRKWYEDNGIVLHTGNRIVSVDRKAKTVQDQEGKLFTYDKLIFACGSAPFVPSIQGIERKGVFVYRTIDDLDAIKSYIRNSRSAAVIGGGLLGLEAAKAVLDDGLKTSVIEFAPRLMPRQLDERGSDILASSLKAQGINIMLNRSTRQILGNGSVEALEFTDDSVIPTDMVVVSAGIRPRDELARAAGLEVGERGGILVNENLCTSDPDIFAIGECALVHGMIWGLVAPCYEMADVVVRRLKGEHVSFPGYDMSTKLKLIGTDVASFGDAFGNSDGAVPIIYDDPARGIYKRINISPDKKLLLGGILVGEASSYNMLVQMALNRLPLPPEPEDLILGARGNGNGLQLSAMDLPDEAMICSCESVSKLAICNSIKEFDLIGVGEIKVRTKAATGCGGCAPMLDELLTGTLKEMGKTVKKTLCEHFDYTRQELYDLIKIGNLRTFQAVIQTHGNGHGCEICKPAVASLLASAWNELIAKQETIQDTNDRFLANIQRRGTYSVVPRIPGGEITPEKLIAIGEVARKYDLYTKITGGQRIDLFGARVDQLPEIWEELIAAGFESGHAYGKALRTVKSCVGSTWCRFGLHDSVSFAIEVEERYKGLRAPHKLKGGVSGCIRECAEARGKDFGIIATEKGWNLYVCGNGGANPKHAQLLAQDIDRDSVIRYLDRFLIYYIKTAEPLTRTAKWLASLEGGMDHLKEVIVNDSLGMAKAFEQEMEQLIKAYKCEWKEVVNSPVLRKKFKHFINSDAPDENIRFQPMRTQKKPVPWGSDQT